MDDEEPDYELEALLALDGTTYNWRLRYIVEFSAWRVSRTEHRPHGLRYALLLRRKSDGKVLVKYDNAHAVRRQGGRYARQPSAHDHRHKGLKGKTQPYAYISPSHLLEDFFADVKESIENEEQDR